MTILIGASSLLGIATVIRMTGGTRVLGAVVVFLLLLLLQVIALQISDQFAEKLAGGGSGPTICYASRYDEEVYMNRDFDRDQSPE